MKRDIRRQVQMLKIGQNDAHGQVFIVLHYVGQGESDGCSLCPMPLLPSLEALGVEKSIQKSVLPKG